MHALYTGRPRSRLSKRQRATKHEKKEEKKKEEEEEEEEAKEEVENMHDGDPVAVSIESLTAAAEMETKAERELLGFTDSNEADVLTATVSPAEEPEEVVVEEEEEEDDETYYARKNGRPLPVKAGTASATQDDHVADDIFLYICAHRLTTAMGIVPCMSSVVFVGDAVEIRVRDVSGLTGRLPQGRHACVRLGLSHVSAMYAIHTGVTSIDFWKDLACSVDVNISKGWLQADTQKFCRLTPVYCSDMAKGFLLQEEQRATDTNGETWTVRHVARDTPPYDLEISVKRFAVSIDWILCVVPSRYLGALWARSLGIDIIPPPEGRYIPLTTEMSLKSKNMSYSLLSSLTTQVVLDFSASPRGTLFLPVIEKMRLEEHISAQSEKRSKDLANTLGNLNSTAITRLENILRWDVYRSAGGSTQDIMSAPTCPDPEEEERKALTLAKQRQLEADKKAKVPKMGLLNNRQRGGKARDDKNNGKWKGKGKKKDTDADKVKNDEAVLESFQSTLKGKWSSTFSGEKQVTPEGSSDEYDSDEDADSAAQFGTEGQPNSMKKNHGPEEDSNPYPTSDDIFVLRASLSTVKGMHRMSISCAAIEAFLRHSELGKGGYLSICNQRDLRAITEMCSVREVMSSRREVLALQGEHVSTLYIVCQGSIEIDHGHKFETYTTGSLLGKCVLDTAAHVWDADIVTRAVTAGVGGNLGMSGAMQARLHSAQLAQVVRFAEDEDDKGGGKDGGNDIATATAFNAIISKSSSSPTAVTTTKSPAPATLVLLELPMSIMLRYAGQGGVEPRESMECFWRFVRLHRQLLKADFEPVFPQLDESIITIASPEKTIDASPVEAAENEYYFGHKPYLGNDGNSDFVPNGFQSFHKAHISARGEITYSLAQIPPVRYAQPGMRSKVRPNVIFCSRRRFFGPGEEVVGQGQHRLHFLLITAGECSVLRRVETASSKKNTHKSESKNDGYGSGVEIDMGLRLLAGDFLLIDGEDINWTATRRQLFPSSAILPTGTEYVSKGRTHPVYGSYKHTVVACTRVEVTCIPIVEVARCLQLFEGLLALEVKKYPRMLMSDYELEKSLWNRCKWEAQKPSEIMHLIENGVAERSRGTCPSPIKSIKPPPLFTLEQLLKKRREAKRCDKLLERLEMLEEKLEVDPHTNSHANAGTDVAAALMLVAPEKDSEKNTLAHKLMRTGVHSKRWPPPPPKADTSAQAAMQRKIRECTHVAYVLPKYTAVGSSNGNSNQSGKGFGFAAASTLRPNTEKKNKEKDNDKGLQQQQPQPPSVDGRPSKPNQNPVRRRSAL